MKIVRITASNNGGAGLCVQRLHDASVKSGNQEILVIQQGNKKDNTVVIAEEDYHIPYNRERGLIPFCLRRLVQLGFLGKTHYYKYKFEKTRSKRDFLITSPFSFYKKVRLMKEIQDADIINLHWVGDFIDIPSFFKNLTKPVVWSLHDENPARGCLHYDCPFPEYNKLDLKIEKIKRRSIKSAAPIHVVAQSLHMAEVCRRSKVLGRFPITIINNGVNPEQFVQIDKTDARRKLEIDSEKIVYLFSAVQIEDKRKGLDLLISALERFDNPNILLICVGGYERIPTATIEIRCVGFISDYERYSSFYSAADYFVLASSQESFAKTPLESMACGTPVIAFPCSGVEDCVTDSTGVICEGFTENDLYEGIKKALNKQYDRQTLRKYVADNFTFEKMSEKYNVLYKQILAHQEPPKR